MVRSILRVAAVCVVLVSQAVAASAQPTNGFPNWEERVLHQWINRARVEPATELAGCGDNCSSAEMAPTCYTPQPPLRWRYELAVAARFHGDSMAQQNFFAHETPCALRSNIASLYPGSCNGSAACACSGGGITGAGSRVGLFGASYSGEIIAAGYGNPVSAFYGWLHEPAPNSGCSFNYENGHRYLILATSGNSMGAGYTSGGRWGNYYTTDFGGGGMVSKLPSGAHYPRQAATIEFWATWDDTQPPTVARVVIGAVSYPMTRQRGTATRGSWLATVNGLGTGCHRYYFEFLDSGGQPVRYPSTGTFGIGNPSTCADWAGADLPAPTITATAVSGSSVQVSWTAISGATQYSLERSENGVPFAPLVTVSSTGYTDNAVSANRTYLYRVRPVGGSTWSNTDHATTIIFTDDPLIANVTFIRSVHLTELRTAVNAAQLSAGTLASGWTDAPPNGATVKAAHVIELRTSIAAALAAWGKTFGYTNTVIAGATPRVIDFQELRDALK